MEEYVDISKLSVKLINKDVAKKMIIKHHYTHSWTSCRYSIGIYSKSDHSFFDSHDKLIGVATYGYPVGRLAAQSISEELENNQVLELTRLFILDGYGKNVESYFRQGEDVKAKALLVNTAVELEAWRKEIDLKTKAFSEATY